MKNFLPLFLLSSALAAASPLTLDEALARAATRHPRLLAQDARTAASAALVEQAGYRPNPTLGVTLENFAGTGTARGIDALEGTLELSQALERGGKRAKRTAAATQDQAIAEAEAAVMRANILGATARAYVAAVAAARQAALAEEFVALARSMLADAEARRAAGDASAVEPARARAALAAAQADATRQAAALRTARTALAAQWAGEMADAAPGDGSFLLPAASPAPAAWLARLETHPRFLLEQARVAGRRAALDLEQANASQDISVAAGLRYFREGSDAALVAGLSLPLPVRHRNQASIRAARQTLAGAEFEAAALTRELQAELTTLAQEIAAAHDAALRLRRDALPAADEAAALLQRAYAAGQASQFEVLEAEGARHALRRELLAQEAAYAAALAHAEALADPAFTLTRQLLATP